MNWRWIHLEAIKPPRFDGVAFARLLPLVRQVIAYTNSNPSNSEVQRKIDDILLYYFPEFISLFRESHDIKNLLLCCLDWFPEYEIHRDYEAALALAFSTSSYGLQLREMIQSTFEFESEILQELERAWFWEFIENTVAMQLTQGCSVGCSFCTFSPPKLSKGESFTTSDILLLFSRYYPQFRPSWLYHASEVFDWKWYIRERKIHYWQLHLLVMMLAWYVPFVSTAVPRNSEEVVKATSHLIHKISATIDNVPRLKETFSGWATEIESGESYEWLQEYALRWTDWLIHKMNLGMYMIIPNLSATDPKRLNPKSKMYKLFASSSRPFSDFPVACSHGVVITPHLQKPLFNHFVFSRIPTDLTSGTSSSRWYVDVLPKPELFNKPFPKGVLMGTSRYIHSEVSWILHDLLSQWVLVPQHVDDELFQVVLEKYGNYATPLMIKNNTGTALYVFVTSSPKYWENEALIRVKI